MPTWKELGIDIRGRSEVMKESFRATRQIIEFAVNVRGHLDEQSQKKDEDYKELIRRELLIETICEDKPWLEVHFNRQEGPQPNFREFEKRNEKKKPYAQINHWIANQGVDPSDITVITNKKVDGQDIVKCINQKENDNLELIFKVEERTQSKKDCSYYYTPFVQGFESEFVMVPYIDHFYSSSENRGLAEGLCVAMTRARSVLYLSGKSLFSRPKTAKKLSSCETKILEAVSLTQNQALAPPLVERSTPSGNESLNELLAQIEKEHHDWFKT